MTANFSSSFMWPRYMRSSLKGPIQMKRYLKPRITLIALSVFAVSGCAMGTTKQLETAAQPRALGLGIVMPNCVFLCFATNTQTDSEGNGAQSVQSSQTNTVDLNAGVNTNGHSGR